MANIKVKNRRGTLKDLDISKIRKVLEFAFQGLNLSPEDMAELEMDSHLQFRDGMSTKEIQAILIRTAAEKVSPSKPQWEYVAARLLLYDIYKEISIKRSYDLKKNGIINAYRPDYFYNLIEEGIKKGLYGDYLLKEYSKEEVEELANYIRPERDLLFKYVGIKVLSDRYLVRDHDSTIYELPQEMYMLIAMTLAIPEKKEDRIKWVKKFYDLLSEHKVTVATPTLMNARRRFTQLSSCFVATIDDDLFDIFDNYQKIAQISKHAGGLGIYIGKLRARGAPIRGFKGASSGIIPPVRIINDIMTYVDQLGMRKGSASVTVDVWHRDILDFLEVKTNSGDERMKAHDIFPAISVPDLFMKRVKKAIEGGEKVYWSLFDPYSSRKKIKELIGEEKDLADFYGEEFEEIYLKLEEEAIKDKEFAEEVVKIDIFELWRKIMSVVFETGMPFFFFRDNVNKVNPNKHAGMIYSSNLCMEITENMSPAKHFPYELDLEEGIAAYKKKLGSFPVCNLASINLGKVNTKEDFEEVMPILIRMLDNVISINYYPIPDAKYYNYLYRSIGIGVSNYHYLLAKKGIHWESEEHLKFADKLFELISYNAIKASMELAKEKGKYKLFDGSNWSKGIFFGKNLAKLKEESEINGNNLDWESLIEDVKKYGMRNANLLALMPTGSTSLILGATASIDPIFNLYYKEENMSGILPQVVPEVNKLFFFYKSAYEIDQKWSIKAAARRQKWIDQSQSFNLYVDPKKIDGPTLSSYYILAWELGLKTIYYLRSKSITEIEECESCSV